MKKIIIFTLVVVLSYIVFHQYRDFYTIENLTFTVWKRWGGRGYIMPYKYWGFSVPKDNYINISNLGSLSAFIVNDSTFIFYCESQAYNDIKINITDYSFIYYPCPTNLQEVHEKRDLYFEDSQKYSKILFEMGEAFAISFPKK